MKFGHEILKYRDDILRDLAELVAIPSVYDTPLPGKPFGEASAKALECILNMAKRLGFETDNVDNYAGDAHYGHGNDHVDILTHVDVVPVGDGWDSDPFCTVEKDGILYGRGVADDKGAAVVSLYCLKALKDSGIQGKHVIRTIFGAGEEIASNDLDKYYEKHPYPVMGFTPDCAYGICHSEKGILRVDFLDKDNHRGCIQSFQAGLAVNAVPAKATATVLCTPQQRELLLKTAKVLSFGNAGIEPFTFRFQKNLVEITACGRAAHGAEPELGLNAASMLIHLLTQVFTKEESGSLLTFLSDCISTEYNGSRLGIQMSDEVSGPLTLNLGIVEIHSERSCASIDIRYPVTKNMNFIVDMVSRTAQSYKLTAEIRNHNAPLYIPEDSTLIQLLKDAYASVMGKPCDVFSTGGGTYARGTNNKTVAFGPIFPSEPSSNAHNCNERINLENFFLHAQICLEAMYLLFTN